MAYSRPTVADASLENAMSAGVGGGRCLHIA